MSTRISNTTPIKFTLEFKSGVIKLNQLSVHLKSMFLENSKLKQNSNSSPTKFALEFKFSNMKSS